MGLAEESFSLHGKTKRRRGIGGRGKVAPAQRGGGKKAHRIGRRAQEDFGPHKSHLIIQADVHPYCAGMKGGIVIPDIFKMPSMALIVLETGKRIGFFLKVNDQLRARIAGRRKTVESNRGGKIFRNGNNVYPAARGRCFVCGIVHVGASLACARDEAGK